MNNVLIDANPAKITQIVKYVLILPLVDCKEKIVDALMVGLMMEAMDNAQVK